MTWEQQRVGRFTASQIHKLLNGGRAKNVVFGDKALSYIHDIAAEILTGEAEKISSKAMEWGLLNESRAIAAYNKRLGLMATYYGAENPLFIEHGEYAGGSPDGITETHLLEVKCPFRSANHVENMTMNIEAFKSSRLEYYAQMQFNMLLTKKNAGHFISFDPRMASEDQQLFVLEIQKDEPFQNLITQRIALAEIELKNTLKIILK